MTSRRWGVVTLLSILGIASLLSVAVPVCVERAHAATVAEEIAAKGDPGAEKYGTASDVTVADAAKGVTLADLANQAGQNKIAINFVWTLICGFLVMFMQAGFAIVETGLIRAKSANHTMMMNFMVYGLGLFA